MTKNPRSGFVFDFDGTIGDSVPLICTAAQLAYADLGVNLSRELIIGHIGLPLSEAGEKYIGPNRGAGFSAAYQRHYKQMDAQIQPFAGAVEMLRDLHEAGVKVGVCTSKRERSARMGLEETGLLPYVQALTCFESTEQHKPAADPALDIAAKLGLDPADCIFIGDSRFDLLAGQAAGMQTCAVPWGAGTLAELLSCQPDYLVFSVGELHTLLLQLAKK